MDDPVYVWINLRICGTTGENGNRPEDVLEVSDDIFFAFFLCQAFLRNNQSFFVKLKNGVSYTRVETTKKID